MLLRFPCTPPVSSRSSSTLVAWNALTPVGVGTVKRTEDAAIWP